MAATNYLREMAHRAARSLWNRSPRRADSKRAQRRAALEALESRRLLSASVTINAANQLAFLGDSSNDDVTVAFAPSAAGGAYTINDAAVPINVVANDGSGVTTAGSGTNTVIVTNLSSLASASLSFDGNGNGGVAPGDLFNIQSSNDPVAIDQTGPATAHDTFNLGNSTDGVQTIPAPVSLRDTTGAADVTVDDSADTNDQTYTLAGGSSVSTISDLAPGIISFANGQVNSLTVNGGNGNDDFTVDFSGGNPIPTLSTPGLFYSGGGGSDNILNLAGTPPSGKFTSVVPKATGHGSGSITFVDQGNISTELSYIDLTPLTDTTPAVDYTFNDFGYPDQSFSADTGPVEGGFQTIEFASTPTPPFPTNFETTDIANKNFVTFNTPPMTPGVPGLGIDATVNIPVPSDGLLSLTFNTLTGGDNTVNFVNTPPGVVTSLSDGAGSSTFNVTGLGIADGTVLFLNGGAGNNTVNYDAGGEAPTVTPGLLPGEVLISIPGAGVVDAINCSQINISNVSPLTITPGPAVTIDGVEGAQLVNTVVGTFTAPILTFPSPTGFAASDFIASIDWGDGSPIGAGTITQNASTPSIYSISGTHTFAENGTYTVTSTVVFAGASFIAPVNAVPVSFSFAGPTIPITFASATVTVTQAPLIVSAFPIVGAAGTAIPIGPIASFTDTGGVEPIADYSATIDVTNSAGTLVVSVPAASIVQNGSAAQYTVNAPAFTLPKEGTYQVVVAVTDDGGANPITVDGASTATISAPLPSANVVVSPVLTPVVNILPGANTGTITVATFTDSVPKSLSHYTAKIDWGDGHTTTGAITFSSGKFTVKGSHTYSSAGEFSPKVTIQKDALTPKSVTDTDRIVVQVNAHIASDGGVTFSGLEGRPVSPTVANFTAVHTSNPASDYSATINWGDGSASSAGTVVSTGGGHFHIVGSHVYDMEATYTATVTLKDIFGDTVIIKSTAKIADAPLELPAGTPHTVPHGSTFTNLVLGSFRDDDAVNTNPANYVGTIDWGDGSTSAAKFVFTSATAKLGSFWNVEGTHKYGTAKTYTVTISIHDIDSPSNKILITTTIKAT